MNKLTKQPKGPVSTASISRPFTTPKPSTNVASVTSVLQKAKDKKALPTKPTPLSTPRALQRRGSTETMASTASCVSAIRRVNLREKYGPNWEPGQPRPASYLAMQTQANDAGPVAGDSKPAKGIIAADLDFEDMAIGNAKPGPNDQRGIAVPTPGKQRRPSITQPLKAARDRLLSNASTRRTARHETDQPQRSFYDSSRSTASSATLFVRSTNLKSSCNADTISIGPGVIGPSRGIKEKAASLSRTGSLGSRLWLNRAPKAVPPRPGASTKAETLPLGMSKKVHYLPPDKVAMIAKSRPGHRKASSSSSFAGASTAISPGRAVTVRIIERDSKQMFDPETIHQGFPPKDKSLCEPLPAYEFPRPAPRPPKDGYKATVLGDRKAAEEHSVQNGMHIHGQPAVALKPPAIHLHLLPLRTPGLALDVTAKRRQQYGNVPEDVSDCEESPILSGASSVYSKAAQDDHSFLSESRDGFAADFEASSFDLARTPSFACTTSKSATNRGVASFSTVNSTAHGLPSAYSCKGDFDGGECVERGKASIQVAVDNLPSAHIP
ncbi:hypothetical protein BKA70DRAFT_1558422 [Coprinopsis sp. MPI-PUGE-AT-0042]|nr:hypothetical protein BKA70DRAFT_1558422 [Coprinopsis sp. MPI-PUGE-AT-0042]